MTQPAVYASVPRARRRVAATAPAELLDDDWFPSFVAQMTPLLELKRGWSGPGSERIEPNLFLLAARQLALVMPQVRGAVAPTLVPTREGGLQLEWHRKGWDVEIEVSPYRRAWVYAERVVLGVEAVEGFDEWDAPLSDSTDQLKVLLKDVADR